jgi:deoxyribodipyrimidine photo-lyase
MATVKPGQSGFAIHVFTNDMRLEDNLCIYELTKRCKRVLPVFVANSPQLASSSRFVSANAIRFMREALDDLNIDIESRGGSLCLMTTDDFVAFCKEIATSSSLGKLQAVSISASLTLFGQERSTYMGKMCSDLGVEFVETWDFTLAPPFAKGDGSPYVIYHAFQKKFDVTHRTTLESKSRSAGSVTWLRLPAMLQSKHCHSIDYLDKYAEHYSPLLSIKGGRQAGLAILSDSRMLERFSSRDDLSTGGGTYMSAYLNFGCISPREVWRRAMRGAKGGTDHGHTELSNEFCKQMVWRDFYYSLLLDKNNRVYRPMGAAYRHIKYTNSPKMYKLLWECKTGFYMVDAGMRQLKLAGVMPNRIRMIWAWFCIKVLHIDPYHKEYGAYYIFSRLLVDACASQNKFNFDWILSTLDLGGRRYSRGHPLAGRYMDVGNGMIRKYKATKWIDEWLPADARADTPKELVDYKARYLQYADMCRAAHASLDLQST